MSDNAVKYFDSTAIRFRLQGQKVKVKVKVTFEVFKVKFYKLTYW